VVAPVFSRALPRAFRTRRLSQKPYPPSSIISTSNTNTFKIERKSIIFKEPKKRWAIKGDRNTDFFHLSIIKRNRKNTISFLTNPDGTHSTTPDQIAATLTSYFQSIFTSSISLSQRSNAQSPPST
jgi:hypothetical protein